MHWTRLGGVFHRRWDRSGTYLLDSPSRSSAGIGPGMKVFGVNGKSIQRESDAGRHRQLGDGRQNRPNGRQWRFLRDASLIDYDDGWPEIHGARKIRKRRCVVGDPEATQIGP